MPQIFGKVSRALPIINSDNTQVQQRVTGYGDLVTTQLGDNHSSLADEGSYFKATNASGTFGAGITAASVVTYTAASPVFMLTNASSAATGKRVFLDYVRLFVASATGTTATNQSIQCAVVLDDNTVGSGRFVSGGSVGNVFNVNSASSITTISSFLIGNNLTCTTAGNPRQIVRAVFKTQSAVTSPLVNGDVYAMDFGEHSAGSGVLTGSSAGAYAFSVGPAVIGSGHSLLFYLWYPNVTNIAPAFEYEIGWWER